MIRIRSALAALCAGAALTASSCPARDDPREERVGGPRMEPGQVATARDPTPPPGTLATVPAAPVEDWTGPGGRPFDVATRTNEYEAGHPRTFGSIVLPTALRPRALGQYPCTSCHLGRKIVMADTRIGDAHQNVEAVHPEQTGAVCSTCHASDNVELLPLKGGARAPLDQSYRLCAQCHFPQVNAWANGGHGKRLDGWQGRRVVMGCGDCHDPHRPALEPRIPFRAPQIERDRRNDR